ncbi:MAG: hypothetical protein AB7P21_20770 [Lautropia sp.]
MALTYGNPACCERFDFKPIAEHVLAAIGATEIRLCVTLADNAVLTRATSRQSTAT